MSAPALPPIIIIKKKGGHGGHHGGAWKVAYADFVTAMMALFIVLWLLNSSQEVQKAVAGYFRDPRGSGKKMGSAFGGTGESLTVDRKNLSDLKDKLQQAMKETPKFDKIKNNVEMTVTGEGLRIELLESEKGTFFESGQAKPTGTADDLLIQLAKQLAAMSNTISIEGHTDAKPYGNGGDYSNWELSTDRANAARKVMEANGLKPEQVVEIRGFAAQQLRLPDKPDDPSNRRISIIVRYNDAPPGEEKEEKEGKEGEKKEGGKKEGEKKPGAEGKDAKEGEKKGHEAETKGAKPEGKAAEAKPESKPAEKEHH